MHCDPRCIVHCSLTPQLPLKMMHCLLRQKTALVFTDTWLSLMFSAGKLSDKTIKNTFLNEVLPESKSPKKASASSFTQVGWRTRAGIVAQSYRPTFQQNTFTFLVEHVTIFLQWHRRMIRNSPRTTFVNQDGMSWSLTLISLMLGSLNSYIFHHCDMWMTTLDNNSNGWI